MTFKKPLAATLLVLAVIANPAAAQQDFPAKSLHWLVPYPAGGGSDFLARAIGQKLSTQVGQPVLVDNKPGGNSETTRWHKPIRDLKITLD